MLGEARRAAIADMLRASGAVTVAEIEEQLGVSPMTARRDLIELARRGVAQRTYGGAVLPTISAHEDSFAARLRSGTEAKEALAEAAVELITPRDAVFLDSSSTTYYLARRILELGIELTIVTNSLPIMQLLATQATGNLELVAVGGWLRSLTQSFVGPDAIRAVSAHFTDHAFLSCKAVAESGVMADADPLEAELKRVMISQARDSTLLIEGSKLTSRGLNAIGPVSDLSLVLASELYEADLRQLRAYDVGARGVMTLTEPGREAH
jgi:DeoR/GlpR family transcriptional regulator of sugar metabolism